MTNDSEIVVEEKISGPISDWLSNNGFENIPLKEDHLGIEVIKISPNNLLTIVEALKNDGFNYLQCQGGYDEGPGLNIVCFYNLIEMNELKEDISPREVRLKVFLDRNGDLTVPSLYSLFRGADWQERETFDMYGVNFQGHPHPKRLLMPEDWKGWPLRKDYVQPDFYEMQDAY
ncbi:NADH dehydrogenase subunit C [Prochlorococcus marinus str. NATL2A]|uniref:NAD(P)H-quinone oxidoreductase subunit J n=1 Tax=Prochlorococcus marinus (strain NATL2A) TaxID=59920 RepID=NDHJ_PROMT|nr:NAD(P)H-quinone oxidoreductase subunit J [Prochlorococcus marinus]Q46H82.1 RecName: Full=NAD(P)H-quinone oxidoreductase subunit J; AltName: Full=NAD(P)H dehydrogenase subunit J; AltName: Full=NADH-plastoquinone oxidoreductase subunit J; AltName: Full=NDH-1 subunit J; Short=NDH-J [Prochlorococcus marinus str. NATL2A]AAZ59146.1 NADH dehydrogenase subunit C [Prochlorococcus marinus str. NATL2A]